MGDVVSDFHQIAVGTGHALRSRPLVFTIRCRATFAEASFCCGQRKIPVDARTQTRKSPPEQFFIKIKLHATALSESDLPQLFAPESH